MYQAIEGVHHEHDNSDSDEPDIINDNDSIVADIKSAIENFKANGVY